MVNITEGMVGTGIMNITQDILGTTSVYEKNSTPGISWNSSSVDGEDETAAAIGSSKLASILYTLIGCLGIVGNLTVLIVFASAPKLRKNLTNIYIMNQSSIDSVVSVFLISTANLSSVVTMEGSAGDYFCMFWQSRTFLWGFLTTSTYNLVALTIERYAEVVHPIWHKLHFTRTKAYISIAAIWIIWPIWEGVGKIPTSEVIGGKCSLYTKWPSDVARKIYGINVTVCKLIIPLIVLVYAYGRIAWVLHKKLKPSAPTSNGDGTSRESRLSRSKNNTIKTVFIISVCFFFCWVWNQTYFLLFNLGFPLDFTPDFYHFTVMAVYVNCCINPFIYAIKYEQFQEAARGLFCRFLKANRVGDASETSRYATGTTGTTSNTGN